MASPKTVLIWLKGKKILISYNETMTDFSVTKGNYMEILTYGKGERLLTCSSAVAEGCSGDCRIIILPIPTTKDGVTVFGTETPLFEVVSQVESGTLVAGYGIPDNVADGISKAGGFIYDGSLDEKFVSDNAELTAIGTVGWLLTNVGVAPSELSFGIIGYGRIGKRLIRHLLFLGAKVRLYTSSAVAKSVFSEMGIDVRDYRSSCDYSGLDILINTAPASIFSQKMKEKNPLLTVIDLASGSYLSDIDGLVKLPSVPEKYFAKSAGRLYAQRILERTLDGCGEAEL